MRAPVALVAVLVCVLSWPSPAVAADAEAATGPLTVTLDRSHVRTRLGDDFTFTSAVRNETGHPATGLVAHLNIVSLDPDVYVDPEDWSSQRTRYLTRLDSGQSLELTWRVQAVNSGRLVVYVAVTARSGSAPVTGSTPLRLIVTEHRTLDPAGALPVTLATPLVLLVLVAAGARRRRARR